MALRDARELGPDVARARERALKLAALPRPGRLRDRLDIRLADLRGELLESLLNPPTTCQWP